MGEWTHPIKQMPMATTSGTTKTFVITVSSRALFDLEESNRIFEEKGMEAFIAHQRNNQQKLLKPGPAMGLVKKLLGINARLPEGAVPFEVVLLSRNSPETAAQVLHAIEAMGLPITRMMFTSGAPTSTYIKALETKLFLSSNPIQVAKALDEGIAAATVLPPTHGGRYENEEKQLRIAFDGDAVLFSDESERACHEGGLDGFHRHEAEREHVPMDAGPFRGFLEALHDVQQAFPPDECPIRTALVTARGAPAHKRAIRTLQDWDVRIDEMMFLGGRNKGPFLRAFGADLFFDDGKQNIANALEHVPAAHVPYGVRNAPGADDTRFTGGAAVAVAPSAAAPEVEVELESVPRRPRRP